MKKLSREIIRFFEKQGFVIVSTIDRKGGIHTSAKGIVGIEESGKVFLLDLYRAKTFRNLKRNPKVSITAVNEHEFQGYNLKGHARIVEKDKFEEHIIKVWQDRIAKRITNRVIRNIKGEKRLTGHHPEARMPSPEYLIEMDVEEIVDLTPRALK